MTMTVPEKPWKRVLWFFNIFDATSPVRSQRLQGAVITVAGAVASLMGVQWTEDQTQLVLKNLNELAVLAGSIVALIGGLRAPQSPRPF